MYGFAVILLCLVVCFGLVCDFVTWCFVICCDCFDLICLPATLVSGLGVFVTCLWWVTSALMISDLPATLCCFIVVL